MKKDMPLNPCSSQRVGLTLAVATLLTATPPAAVQAQQAVGTARPFTLSFHNADAADVLRAFALQSGLSLAVSPSVKGKIISIRLRNVTPEEALRLITQAAGVTYRKTNGAYVVGSEEEMKLTRSSGSFTTYPLKNITAAAAKTLIEGTLPYVLVQGADGAGRLTLTGSIEDVRSATRLLSFVDVPGAPVAEVITPVHVTAAFLSDVIRKAEPGVTIDVQGNTLIATGPRDAVARAKAIIPAVDVVNSSSQRVEIYRIRYSSAASLSAMLATALPGVLATPSAEPYAPAPARFQPLTGGSLGAGSFTTGGGAGGGVSGSGLSGGGSGLGGGGGIGVGGVGVGGIGTSVIKSRQIILSGPDAQVDQALRLLKEIDVAPAQVSIEARIMDITNGNDLNLGIQWGGLIQSQQAGGGGGGGGGGGAAGNAPPTFTQGVSPNNSVRELNAPDVIRFGRFARSPLNLAAQLQFLETQNRAKTLANPRIAVLDNEDANIFIGQIRRFNVLAVSSATAGNAFTVQEVPIGIALLVRPRVNDNGEITIKVHPVVSTLTGLDGNLPQTAAREADTTLRVRDGDTIAIGGLLQDEEIRTLQQVPLLGNIPFFGELFRNRRTVKQRSEVVIFLTIRLMPTPDGPPSDASTGSPIAPSVFSSTTVPSAAMPMTKTPAVSPRETP